MVNSDSEKLVHEAIDIGYSNKSKRRRALDLLTKAIEADKQNPQAFFERGMVHLEGREPEKALSDFSAALEIDERFPGARDWRARVYEELGSSVKAAEDRLIDLKQRPERHIGMGVSPQSWADCASSFLRAGMPDRSIAVIEEYLRDHEVAVTAYKSYGSAPYRVVTEALIATGDFEKAVNYGLKAYQHDNSCPADLLVYKEALEGAGRSQEAKKIEEEYAAQMPPGYSSD